MEDIGNCCTTRPKNAVRTGQDPFERTKLPPKGSSSERSEDDEPEELGFADRALSLFGGGKKPKAKKGETSPGADDSLMGRTISMFGGKKAAASSLPANWSKTKDKAGKECYYNNVTKVTQYTVPRPLPKGWVEMVHKESGQPCYKNVATRQVQFSFPPDDEEDEESSSTGKDAKPAEDENFLSKTMSFMTGGPKKAQAAPKKENRDRDSKKESAKEPDKNQQALQRVFISATSLIKEVKLCCGPEKQLALDSMAADLKAHKISAEQAIPKLQALVGNTLVQQAAICVQNLKNGTLPHGWIEYFDNGTHRHYYYNAHTKHTQWTKPSQRTSEATQKKELEMLAAFDDEETVGLDFTPQAHEIALSADL